MIVAIVPFPYIFKARTLSKSWLAKFSPVASLDDEVQKKLAILFQKEVGNWSYNWETYFRACFGIVNSFAFHVGRFPIATSYFELRRSMPPPMPLSKLPPLSFLPEDLTISTPEMEEPLLYWCYGLNEMIFYVANILARSWKPLPRRPQTFGDCRFYRKKLVIQNRSQTYKAVVFCGNERDLRVQVYDSRSQVWTSSRFRSSKNLKLLCPVVHLDGIPYMVAYHNRTNVMAFNVKKRTLESLRFFSTDQLLMNNVELVVYDARLLLIVSTGLHPGGLQVLKFDSVTEQLLEVARHPLLNSVSPTLKCVDDEDRFVMTTTFTLGSATNC